MKYLNGTAQHKEPPGGLTKNGGMETKYIKQKWAAKGRPFINWF
ncbi:hypothetical protein ACEN9X_25065 [Mucilaginibacter sp. Mucisp86]